MEVPKLDARRVLESLTTNTFIPGFNYIANYFSFRTLFYLTPLEYCFCPCGYNHEYLSYISPTGEVDKDMFEEILKCITKDECPHVAGAPADHVKRSKVYGMHFIAALGTKEAISYYSQINIVYTEMSGLFKAHPCSIALMRKQYDVMWEFLKNYPSMLQELQHVPYAIRLSDDPLKIRVENIHLLELCIRQNHKDLLIRFLECWPTPKCLKKMLAFTFEHGFSLMQNTLLDHMKALVQGGNTFYIYKCAEVAIMFKRVGVLHQVLSWSPTSWSLTLDSNVELRKLMELCNQFQREDCFKAIKRFLKLQEDEVLIRYLGDVDNFLFCLINDYIDFESIRDGNLPALKKITKSKDEQACLGTAVHNIIAPRTFREFSAGKTHALQVLLEQGADIHSLLGQRSIFILDECLSRHTLCQLNYKESRHIFEILLGSNIEFPEPDKLKSTKTSMILLHSCVKLDFFLKMTYLYSRYRPGDFRLDMVTHTFSRHTQKAFDFVLPLLIECGYKFEREGLLKAIEHNLHGEEVKYIEQTINEVRSLMKQCRDVLRRHFKGSRIHAYMEMMTIPLKIKNYILLKDVLLIGSISVKYDN